jgi:hypothetical protein
MVVIFPDSALVWLLQQIAATTGGLVYHIYNNDAVWSAQTGLSDLNNADALFPPQTVLLSDWIVRGVTDDVGYLQAPDLVYTNFSGVNQTVFGYYVTDASGAFLVAGGRFDGAPLVVQPTGTFSVTPQLGSYSANVAS